MTEDDKNRCPICGYLWEAHEFAVPAPYCPASDEAAAENVAGYERYREMLKERGITIGEVEE